MSNNLAVPVILSMVLATLFYFVDLYNEKIKIKPSIIAGISLAYFFLVVLPEVSMGLPRFPFDLPAFEYLFVLAGVVFTHVIEKFIVQHAEVQTRQKVLELMRKKDEMDQGETRLAQILREGIKTDSLNDYTIRNIADIMADAIEEENEIKEEMKEIKKKLQDHLSDLLEKTHAFIEAFYHLIMGILMSSLLLVNLVQGLLFFLFAFLMAVVAHVESRNRIFSDLDIEMQYKVPRKRKIILSLAAPIGVVMSLIIDFTVGINLEFIYILFSFISGSILYTTMREVIPEKEKGNLPSFIISLVVSCIMIFLIKILEHHFIH